MKAFKRSLPFTALDEALTVLAFTGARETRGGRASLVFSKTRLGRERKLSAATKRSVAHARRRSVGSAGNFRFAPCPLDVTC